MTDRLKVCLWRFENEVVGFVDSQATRGWEFVARDGFSICSADMPEARPSTLFVRGSDILRDGRYLYLEFSSVADAAAWCARAKQAIAEFNAGAPTAREVRSLPQLPSCERVL